MSRALESLMKGKKTELKERHEKLLQNILDEAKTVGIRAATLKTRGKKYDEATKERDQSKPTILCNQTLLSWACIVECGPSQMTKNDSQKN